MGKLPTVKLEIYKKQKLYNLVLVVSCSGLNVNVTDYVNLQTYALISDNIPGSLSTAVQYTDITETLGETCSLLRKQSGKPQKQMKIRVTERKQGGILTIGLT